MALNQSEDRFNGVIASLAIKAPCRAVSDTANILLEGEQTVDTIPVVTGDRVLVAAQTDPVDNGIYNVSTGSWDRAADFDGNRDVAKGTIVNVNVPTNSITSYVQTSDGVSLVNPVIGTDPITFTIFFSLNNSLDDLSDVDLTGCSDDDMMHFVGGVLVCTLGQLTYDGVSLLNAGPIGVTGFGNEAAQLRGIAAAALVPSVNPRRNDQFSGIGGAFGNLDFLHDNNATSSFLGLRLRKQADLFSTREWNVEGISASTTQTQGEKPVKSSLVRVTVVANANDVITLRAPELGMDQIIMNRGANTLQIFPASGHDLGQGTDNPMLVATGGTAIFVGISSTIWHLVQVSTGSGSIGGAFRGAKVFGSADFNPTDINGLDWDGVPGLTPAPYNSEVFDTDSIHDNAVNNSRLFTPAGISKIVLSAGATMTEADTGGMHMTFRRNGVNNSSDDGMPNYSPHSTHGSWGSKGFGVEDDANIGYVHYSGIIQVATPGTDFYECMMGSQGNPAVCRGGKYWFQMEIIE